MFLDTEAVNSVITKLPARFAPLTKVVTQHPDAISLPVLGFLDQVNNATRQEELEEVIILGTLPLISGPINEATGNYLPSNVYFPAELELRNATVQALGTSPKREPLVLKQEWCATYFQSPSLSNYSHLKLHPTQIEGVFVAQVFSNREDQRICEERLVYVSRPIYAKLVAKKASQPLSEIAKPVFEFVTPPYHQKASQSPNPGLV